ncbi:MAG: hypothetical protein NXI15_17265 [Gammaproteobacteria bacterium]|nr:hypothetical protein [Gammaproteobacteria bacterium]
MASRFSQSSLSQQLALVAASLCLLVGLALVALGAISSRHMQLQLQDEYGNALAQLIASRVGSALEIGDLLSVTASLRRFIAISAAEEAVITDIEGKELGHAGQATGLSQYTYSAPVAIDADVAGEVTITLNADAARAAQSQLIASLLGLTLLLSLATYAGVRHFGQRLADRVQALARAINLEDQPATARPRNELAHLEKQVQALPMDLLRTRSEPGPQDENYRTTAVLYLHLDSLVGYVDTLDEQSLQRYTHRLHQVVYAAAGFYAGDIHVARQFGLAVFFSGDNKSGSAAFRAASSAWLIAAVCRELEAHMSLSLKISMAVAQSELGVGDGGDIYPGLYMQHTLDELQAVSSGSPPGLMLAHAVAQDIDVASRLSHQATDIGGYARVMEFASTYHDLLERQLRLIMRRLSDPTQLH